MRLLLFPRSRPALPPPWSMRILAAALLTVILPLAARAQGPDLLQNLARAGLKATRVWSNLGDWATSVAFLKDGRHLCVGTYEELLQFDVRDAAARKSLRVAPGYIKSLALSPDGKLLAAGHYQTLTLIDPVKWAVVRTLGEHAGYVTGAAFSPDGRLLATACEDETARVWKVADGSCVHVLSGHSGPVQGVAFSPDGKLIATAAGDETRVTRHGEVKVWNAADGKELHSFETPKQAATAVAFAPDGKTLASAGFDERVILYDLAAAKPTSFFGGHGRPTNAVLFCRDSNTVISASGGRAKDGNEVKVWKRESGDEIATFAGHSAKVAAVALSPDESLLASGGYDKSVIVWDLKSVRHSEENFVDKASAILAAAVKKVADERSAKAGARAEATAESREKTPAPGAVVRVGIIGLDTSHAGAFAKELNNPKAAPDVAGFRVVAAYPRGSADIVSSTERIPQYTQDFQKMGIEIVDSLEALLPKVDVILLETNDGRPHLQQALAVMKAGKPLFIDKPIAASLDDAIAIFDAAKRYNVPVFSSSSLRFGKQTLAARDGKIGRILECQTHSPCALEKTHPDLFWYGIHGVESLFTVMGTGCQSVRRTVSTPTEDVVVGQWNDGRTGTFHGSRGKGGYGGTAKGTTGTLEVGQSEGYRPLVVAIVKFFKTRVPPVSPEETLEIYAFMEAADESKRQHGAEVTLESVMAKARKAAAQAPR